MLSHHYCAFISYRHQSPDMQVAKRLHTLIENYVVPAGLRKEKGQRHLGKVFRDQEELPLSADLGRDIETALDNSDWLICICTPRYLQSRWCLRELEYFIEKHGRERVLTVLAEGEPEDSFPDQLLHGTDDQGNRVDLEPLAANVRGSGTADMLKKLKKEKFRILAPMLSTGFDDLYQRQRRRAAMRALAAAGAVVLLLGAFLAYALAQNARIEKERITAARNECDLLVEKSLSYTAQNRKSDALALAMEAHEVSGTVDGYGEDRIREALASACYDGDFNVEAHISIPGSGDRLADMAAFSPDGSMISAVVSYTQAVVCDAATGEQKWISEPLGNFITDMAWSGDSRLIACVSQWSHTVRVMDVTAGGKVAELVGMPDPVTGGCPENAREIFMPCGVRFSSDGSALFVVNDDGLWRWAFLEDKDPERILELPESQFAGIRFTADRRFLLRDDMQRLQVINLEEGKVTAEYTPETAQVIQNAALSPDGKQMYVHQFGKAYVCDPSSGEKKWETAVESDAYNPEDPQALWLGDVIVDRDRVYSAANGSVLYTLKDRAVGVSPDGEYLMGERNIYFLKDGSLYAEIPGLLLASDATGRHLLVRTKEDYQEYGYGEEASVRALQTGYYKETAPGYGSQTVVEKYQGTLTKIPTWSTPIRTGLYDPYGKSHQGNNMPRSYTDPTGRFMILTNQGEYVPVYDLEKSNEPFMRLFDFTTYVIRGNQALMVPAVAGVAFQAEGSLAAIAGESGYITVYDLETGRLVQSWTDRLYRSALYDVTFNRAGNMIMTANFDMSVYDVYSVTSGLHLYTLHAAKPAVDWGFDEETGDAVVVYQDGSALVAKTFADPAELYDYAGKILEAR